MAPLPSSDVLSCAQGFLAPLQPSPSSVPDSGFLGPLPVAQDVWVVRSLFSIGSGQTEGLTYAGLRGRLLDMLGPNPIAHPALNFANNESTGEELMEEMARVQEVVAGREVAFRLDSTMTIVRREGKLALHSVVPLTEELLTAVSSLGEVGWLIAPNLQHWLFLPAWMEAFPHATVALVPEALGESLEDKMPCLADHKGLVCQLGHPDVMMRLAAETGLTGHMLEGAPLSLNEFLFYHGASSTLVASDSFYGGYDMEETPSWFARLWFKLTRGGSFRKTRLPIYRTIRVVSHGSPAALLQSTAQTLQGLGPVNRITFAHGTSPFTQEQFKDGRAGEPKGWNGHGGLKDLFLHCWRVGLIEQGATGLLDQDLLAEKPVSCCPSCRKANFCTPTLCISALG